MNESESPAAQTPHRGVHRFFAGSAIVFVFVLSSVFVQFPAASPVVPPFKIGERLAYRVDWRKYFGVAEAELRVVDRGNFYGVESWHFRATFHTLEPIRALYPEDDQLDSYDDLGGLASFRYQEHLREAGKPQESNLELVSPGSSSRGDWPRVIVPPGTHDPVSAIYLLRHVNWQRTREARISVYDGENLYDMIAVRASVDNVADNVRIPAGDFSATRIAIQLLENGREVSDEHFTIWLARDAAQTPLILEAQLPLGFVRAELTSSIEVKKARETGKISVPSR